MEIFKWLEDKNLVDSFKVNDYRKTESLLYYNLKIVFIDQSILFVKEYLDLDHRKYSFHWQLDSGELIIRWDNAPHFPEILNSLTINI
jgi:Family of unknown function (DUF6516)